MNVTDWRALRARFKAMEYVELIVMLAKMFDTEVYVELGVRWGGTFNKVAPFVKKAYAIDICELREIKELPNVVKIQKTTNAAVVKWKEPIDMLFIDADHTKKQAMVDFQNWSPFVKEGTGMIFLHDSHPMRMNMFHDDFSGQVWEVAKEIHQNPKYKRFEIVTFPGPYCGFSIIRKLRRDCNHLSWTEDEDVAKSFGDV